MNQAPDLYLFCDRSSGNARTVFSQLPIHIIDTLASADLIWMRDDYAEVEGRLRDFQLFNHIPGEGSMVGKANLTRNLQAYAARNPRDAVALEAFYPQTYRLFVEEDLDQFIAQLPDQDSEDNLWIMKPSDLSSGKGVKVLWDFRQLRDNPGAFLDEQTRVDGVRCRYIIQRYIKDPLLLDGRKSEIRTYFLIASLDPLLVMMYPHGQARLNSQPYQLGDYDNPLVHVTNVDRQKKDPSFDPNAVLKWTFPQLEAYLREQRRDLPEHYIEQVLCSQLRERLAYVVNAHIDHLRGTPTWGLYFGLYGADWIIDDQLRPWLTEIQLCPGLSIDDPVKREVLFGLLQETLWIMVEVQLRKRSRLSLKHLDNVTQFQWIFNEAR